jgi:hypothetical protein
MFNEQTEIQMNKEHDDNNDHWIKLICAVEGTRC